MSRLTIRTLYQDEHWIDINGNVISISTIDEHYAVNIINFLRRRLSHISFTIEMSSIEADDWHPSDLTMDELMNLELVRALRQRLHPAHKWWLPSYWPHSTAACNIVARVLEVMVLAVIPFPPIVVDLIDDQPFEV